MAATRWDGILGLSLWRGDVWVRYAGVAEAHSLAATKTAEVCVSALSRDKRGRVFAPRDARRAGLLDYVLVGYGYAVG